MRFTTQVFVIHVPHGKIVSAASIVAIERVVFSAPTARTESLFELPRTIAADPSEDKTMYRVKLKFEGPFPDRFDFKPPNMAIGDNEYPVRTFTYRLFSDRGKYGLCS